MGGPGINEVASTIVSAQLTIPSSSTSTMAVKRRRNSDEEMRLQTERVGMERYFAAALLEKKNGNMEHYTELIRQLSAVPGTPKALAPHKLHCWVMLIAQSVSQLNRSCHQLVEAILAMDWTVQEEGFVQTYIGFLGVLVSAHAFYSLPVQKMLVHAMTFRRKFNSVYPDTPSNLTRAHVYTRVHNALKYVLSLAPISYNSLFNVLVSEFPHKSQSIQEHAIYTQNMLRLIDYVPTLQEQILSMLVEKMVAIDVEIQVELEELDEEIFEMDMSHDERVPKERTPVNISDLFDKPITEDDTDIVEDDKYEEGDSDSDTASNAPQIFATNIREMAEKLDVIMSQVFAYLKTFQTASLTTEDDLKDMLRLLIGIFDASILTTFKSRHVQFLLFWYAAIRPEFADILLGQFFQKMISKDEPVTIKIASAAYSSSFVARANFISPVHVRDIVNLYLGWANDYIDENEASAVLPAQEKHAVFYAVVQAILYIFCFRWRWLVVDETNEFSDLGGLPASGDAWHVPTHMWTAGLTTLQHVIQSRFNPLKVCSVNVVRQFARLAHATNFLYVYPILENNRRLALPPQKSSFTVSQKNTPSSELAQQDIESFFPFDPIKLLHTSKGYVEPFYQEWDGGIAEEDSDDEVDNEDEEEEDDEMAGVEWSGAVSISPSPRFEALWAGMA